MSLHISEYVLKVRDGVLQYIRIHGPHIKGKTEEDIKGPAQAKQVEAQSV